MFESSSSSPTSRTPQPELKPKNGAAAAVAVAGVECSTSSLGSASTVLTLESYSSGSITSGSIADDIIVYPPSSESTIRKPCGVRFATEVRVYPFERHDKREGNLWYSTCEIDSFFKSSLDFMTNLACPTTREWWRASQRVETRPPGWMFCLFPQVYAQSIHDTALTVHPQYLGLYSLAWTEKIGERRELLCERILLLQRRLHRQEQMRRASEYFSHKDVQRALYMGECIAKSILEEEEEDGYRQKTEIPGRQKTL